MLSQPENRIDFRRIMDMGQILLVDLSGIGTEIRELLGSFILSLLHITTLSRSNVPIEKRKRFHIFCDEAHRFLRSPIEDLIVETRKFNVSLTLAHQYLRQFDQATRDGILTAGSTIIFNVDLNDSRYLAKDLQGKVQPEDLCMFEVGEAIARIGTRVIRLKTCNQAPIPSNSPRKQIIRQSHERYYCDPNRVGEIRSKPWGPADPDTASSPQTPADSEEYRYDQFE